MRMRMRPGPRIVLPAALLASFGIVLAIGGPLGTSASGPSGDDVVRLVVDLEEARAAAAGLEPFAGLVVSVTPVAGAGPADVCVTEPRDGWEVRGEEWEPRSRPDGTAVRCRTVTPRDGVLEPIEIRLVRP